MEAAAAQQAFERLRESQLPRVLFVSHGAGGGVARHIADLVEALRDVAHVLLLQPRHGTHAVLRSLDSDDGPTLAFRLEDEWDAMLACLRALGIARVHYHHVHGWPQRVLDLARDLGAPWFVTLHDYYPACAGYHLTDGAGRYCGGEPGCERCTDGREPQWPLDARGWREAFAPWLASAERVIAPSAGCAATIAGFFPGLQPVVWQHPERAPAEHPALRRVLLAGGISPEKGLQVLEACVRDARARELPLHFRVVGHLAQPLARWPQAPLTVTGEYPEGRLPELLDLERGDVVFFPAQVPETYSYTLSAAIDAGLPIVATNLGALPERLARYPRHRIVAWDADAATMNDALLATAQDPPVHALSVRPLVGLAAYRAQYVEGLAPRPPPAALPPLEPRWLEEPASPAAVWTFFGLVQEALGRGRAIPLADIERRAGEADRRLEEADAAEASARGRKAELEAWYRESEAYFTTRGRELEEQAARLREQDDASRGEIARLREALAHARAEVEGIRASTSWRITAPLRALARWLRR